MEFIDGGKPRKISIDPCGTIHHFAKQAPRELKPHLTLNGQAVSICDIESAHICVLSCIIQERIDWLAKRSLKTGPLVQERQSFIALLESTDIYEHRANGEDRRRFKNALLASINMPTKKEVHSVAYQRFRNAFPLTVGIVEDIKKKGTIENLVGKGQMGRGARF